MSAGERATRRHPLWRLTAKGIAMFPSIRFLARSATTSALLGISLLAPAAPIGTMIAAPAAAQEPRSVLISIYRGAPGQQLALLKWLAQQDSIAQSAGLPPSQLYVHQDGASWDYLVIGPATTPQQDAAVEAAAKKMGATAGPMVGIELRRYITEHDDTVAAGPTTAAEWLRRLGQ